MNRTKIMEAIEKAYLGQYRETLKRLSDASLISLAQDLGIDTDALLSEKQVVL